MEGVQLDFKKISAGIFKWILSAIGFLIVSLVLAYLASDLINTHSGLFTVGALLIGGFIALVVFLAVVVEPLGWLERSLQPGGATLERRLQEAKNSFVFDVFELVMSTSLPSVGQKILEFQKAHPNPTAEETKRFRDQLSDDAEKGHIVPLDEEAVEDLSLVIDYMDIVSELRGLKEHAQKQLRRFAGASAVYYPGSVLAAALAAGYSFGVETAIGILYSAAAAIAIYVRFGMGPNMQKLRWWKKVLERLKEKDSRGVKRSIEEMEPPPFPIRRHV